MTTSSKVLKKQATRRLAARFLAGSSEPDDQEKAKRYEGLRNLSKEEIKGLQAEKRALSRMTACTRCAIPTLRSQLRNGVCKYCLEAMNDAHNELRWSFPRDSQPVDNGSPYQDGITDEDIREVLLRHHSDEQIRCWSEAFAYRRFEEICEEEQRADLDRHTTVPTGSELADQLSMIGFTKQAIKKMSIAQAKAYIEATF